MSDVGEKLIMGKLYCIWFASRKNADAAGPLGDFGLTASVG